MSSTNPTVDRLLSTPTSFTQNFYNTFIEASRIVLITLLFFAILYFFVIIHLMSTDTFYDNVKVRSALKKDVYDDGKASIVIRGNLLLTKLNVKHNYGHIVIKVPIKFTWQLTPKLDLTQEMKSRIDSPEFKGFLKSYYEYYRFSEPVRERNAFIIKGEVI